MMLSNLEIKPNIGFGGTLFGSAMAPLIKQLGKPEEIENFDDDEEFNTTLLHYWKIGFSVFFVGLSCQILAGFEIDNPDALLFGRKILGKPEDEIISLMKENGHTVYEADTELGDKRLSFDFGMMDFFFRDGVLIYMNFGVMVDEKGNIETV